MVMVGDLSVKIFGMFWIILTIGINVYFKLK